MSTRVYDLPTRIFHWLFALSFSIAFIIANTIDDEEATFSYHMIAGLIMCFSLLWRFFWGLLGTQHARFNDFTLKPTQLSDYLRGAMSGALYRWAGHNPASSWAAVLMMLLAAGLGVSGYAMISGRAGDSVEELHELMANAFIILVVLHLAGILLHTWKYRDALSKSMITGIKKHLPDGQVSVAPHISVGIIAFLLTVGATAYLLLHFDTETRQLKIGSIELHLAEFEEDENEYKSYQDQDRKDD